MAKGSRTWLSAFSALALCTSALAAEGWLSARPDTEAPAWIPAAAAPHVEVLRADARGIDLSIGLDGIGARPRHHAADEFVELTWPDAPPSGKIGQPLLPVIRELLLVPEGALVQWAVTEGDPVVVDLSRAGYSSRVYPRQAPIPKLPGERERATFKRDAAAYALDTTRPTERVLVTELGIIRGNHIFMLEIWPVAYNPARGEVHMWPDLDVRLDFVGGRGFNEAKADPSSLNHLVLNPRDAVARMQGTGNYLIVVAQTFADDITTLAATKAAVGFDVSTYVVAPGSSASTIKSYIRNLWGGPDAPDYILLVGDTNTIPAWTGGGDGSPTTDLPYGCMDGDGDWYPEICIGRFPVRSAAQLQDVIDKTASFEAGAYTDPEYTKRACFMAGVDNNHISEGTHDWVIENYMEPNGYVYDELYMVTHGATTQDVRNSLNDGRFFSIYSGHGGTYHWADGPPFYQEDVNDLQNTGMYSFVYSFACVTGTFSATECFTETLLLAPNRGAVGAIGSSVNSYWTEDDVLEKQLADCIFDYADQVPCEFGPVWVDTMMRYLVEMGSDSTTRRYFEMYNLMGDPSLSLEGGLAALGLSLPDGAPEYLAPGQPTSFTVQINDGLESHVPGSGTLHYAYDGGPFLTSTLAPLGGGLYEATLPAAEYGDVPEFYFSALGDGGTIVHSPFGAPDTVYEATIGVPVVQLDWTMESDPGWTTEGQWGWGTPTGQGGNNYGNPDPSSGYTGSRVYGYNLLGDYANGLSERHLTTGAIDCRELSDVTLRFRRWLNVEQPSYDHAYVRASTDGTSWTTLWENSGEITDTSWTLQELDISSIADDASAVYLRWTMGTTDGSWEYSGWNIDDVEIVGVAAVDCNGNSVADRIDIARDTSSDANDNGIPDECECPADIDGSGDVGFADLTSLLAAWGPCPPSCPLDLDGNGSVGFADLTALLANWGACGE